MPKKSESPAKLYFANNFPLGEARVLRLHLDEVLLRIFFVLRGEAHILRWGVLSEFL